MAKKGQRIIVGLHCKKCNNRNYITERNKVNTEKKLELKKFCRHCRAKTAHKEISKLK
jgi:large subunit ribosomal protein L33